MHTPLLLSLIVRQMCMWYWIADLSKQKKKTKKAPGQTWCHYIALRCSYFQKLLMKMVKAFPSQSLSFFHGWVCYFKCNCSGPRGCKLISGQRWEGKMGGKERFITVTQSQWFHRAERASSPFLLVPAVRFLAICLVCYITEEEQNYLCLGFCAHFGFCSLAACRVTRMLNYCHWPQSWHERPWFSDLSFTSPCIAPGLAFCKCVGGGRMSLQYINVTWVDIRANWP